MKGLHGLALALLATLQGCASFDYAIPTGISPSAQAPGTAVVILSTGADERSISFARNLEIVDLATSKVVASLPIDNYSLKPHFDDHFGFVHVQVLKPGGYAVRFFALNPYTSAVNPSPLPRFEVLAGETLYVGELYALPGSDEVDEESFSNLMKVNDRAARDLAIVRRSNPELTDDKVVVRLMK